MVAGFAIAFTHVASASPTPPPPCAPSPPCAQSWFARSTAAAPLHHLLAPLQRLNAHRRPRLSVRLHTRRGSVAGREGGRSCGKRERKELREERKEGVAGRERGRSCRFAARGSRRVGEIETLNKLYGFGSSNNRSHIPLFGTGSCWTEAKHLMTTSVFLKCRPFLASGLVGPRPITLFGTGFTRTEAYSCLWLRVLAEPRHKTWLKLQKCHRAIICFGSWPTEAYKAR